MGLIGGILYLIGIGLAGVTGANGSEWYFIFISSLFIALGHLFVRAPQIYGFMQQDGFIVIPKLLVINTVWLAVITAPVYLIGTLFN